MAMRSGLVPRITDFSDKVLRSRLKLWQEHLPRNEAFFARDNPEIRERISRIKPGHRSATEHTEPPLQNIPVGNLWDLFFAFARANPDQIDAGEQQVDSGDRKNEIGTRESGQPLGGLLRQRLERKIGTNLADVRIHTNAETAKQLQRASADALTVGNDIYFAPEKYNPESRRGQALLVHELTHVRQQKEIADSGIQLDPTRMQYFEQKALHNERAMLRGTDNLPRVGNAAPAPVLFNPVMHALAQNRSSGATGQNVPSAQPAMAAMNSRNLDTGPVAETVLPEQDDFAETAARTQEIYDALKWRLKIEKERSGD